LQAAVAVEMGHILEEAAVQVDIEHRPALLAGVPVQKQR
jgi:hypothetical protein